MNLKIAVFAAENLIIANYDIRKCEKYVRSIQGKLDKAVANNDKEKIRWYTHLLSKKSRAVKILAIYHVTQENQGKYTAGVDGVKIEKGNDNLFSTPLRILLPDPVIRKDGKDVGALGYSKGESK